MKLLSTQNAKPELMSTISIYFGPPTHSELKVKQISVTTHGLGYMIQNFGTKSVDFNLTLVGQNDKYEPKSN